MHLHKVSLQCHPYGNTLSGRNQAVSQRLNLNWTLLNKDLFTHFGDCLAHHHFLLLFFTLFWDFTLQSLLTCSVAKIAAGYCPQFTHSKGLDPCRSFSAAPSILWFLAQCLHSLNPLTFGLCVNNSALWSMVLFSSSYSPVISFACLLSSIFPVCADLLPPLFALFSLGQAEGERHGQEHSVGEWVDIVIYSDIVNPLVFVFFLNKHY